MKERLAIRITNEIKNQPRTYIALICINVFSFAYIFIFGGYFFRDYSIIFDGGLRILYGQVPYRDFYLPIGPLSLYLQAFFNWICGASATAMHMHTAVLNSIVLSCFFLYARKHMDTIAAAGLTLLLHFCYYGATVNPWYNHTALFFYILAQILVFHNMEKTEISLWKLAATGLLAGLSIFSKQDIGFLGAMFIASQLLLFSTRRIRNTAVYLVSFLTVILLFSGYYISISDFGYWFNYGQSPHSSRFHILKNIFNGRHIYKDVRWHIIFIAPAFFIFLRDYSRKAYFNLYTAVGLAGFSLIINETSGQPKWTAFFALPFIAVSLVRLIAENKTATFNALSRRTVAYLTCWLLLSYSYVIVWENLHPAKFYVKGEYQPLTDSSYAGMRFTPEVIDGINKIKAELANKESPDSDEWLLNMSSYTFLYRDLGTIPPIGTHLWYHAKVTLFERDFNRFMEKLKSKPFEYILLQEMASGTPPLEFRDYLVSIGYKPLFSVPTPKSGRGSRYDLTVYRRLTSSLKASKNIQQPS